jgi:integrase
LKRREKELMECSLAQGTRIHYQKELQWFLAFRDDQVEGEERVRRYITWMEMIGRGGSVPTALAAISRAAVEKGQQDVTKGKRVQIVAEGIARVVARRKKPLDRDPFPVQALEALQQKEGGSTKTRDMALLALGIRGMRRANELCFLRREDVTIKEGMMKVHIRRQKNDQLGRGMTLFIERTDSVICPVKLMELYLQERGDGAGWLFVTATGRQMSTGAVSSLVKRAAEVAGLEGHYSSHSLRIGGATAALEGGMSKEQIKAIGGWSGEAVERYMRAREVAQLRASRLMGF